MSKSSTKHNTSTLSSKYFTITGTIFYAHVRDRNDKGLYPTNMFQLDLSIDDKHKAALEELGVQVKNKGDEKGNFVTLKSQFQPNVIDESGQTILPENMPLIGNGSTATITTSLYNNSEANIKAGKGGRKLLGLTTIRLTNLVPYENTTPKLVSE